MSGAWGHHREAGPWVAHPAVVGAAIAPAVFFLGAALIVVTPRFLGLWGEAVEASAIACFLVASLLGALGQYLYKAGADRSNGTPAGYVLNPHLLAGVVCYIAVMILFVAGFKAGGAMSVLYPLYATTFIWGAIASLVAFGVPIRPINIAGMAFLLLGMYLMGHTPT